MQRRRQESGYALLLIFLMAAAIAISLYKEIPRVAFESQRQKEQLLVSRGEQYKRAIQMFMKANNRWPSKIEDLESFNNRRFLRKRFSDPMTGKDEWRFIHIQNGILVDSVNNKQPGVGGSTGSQSQLVGEMPTTVQDTSNSQPGVNPAMRRRASDGMSPGVGMGEPQVINDPNGPSSPNQNPNQTFPNGQPMPPGSSIQNYPAIQNYPPGANPQTGQNYPPGFIPPQGFVPPQGIPVPGQAGTTYPNNAQPQQYPGQVQQYPGQVQQYPGQVQQYPGQVQQYPGQVQQYPGQVQQYPGQVQQYPGQVQYPQAQQYPGQPNAYPGQVQQYPGQPIPQQYPNQPSTYPGQPTPFQPPQYPGVPGQPVNSQYGGVSPYPTTPGTIGNQPGFGQPGLNPQQNPNAATQMIQQILTTPRAGGMPTAAGGQAAMGAGIAGVASNADAEGIMVYLDHTNYKQWEFIYDPTKVKPIPNPLTGAPGTPASQMGTPASQLGNTPGQQPGQQQGCVPADFMGGTCAGVPPGFGGGGRGGPVQIPPVMNPVIR